jgi:hypothetical protein
MIREMDQTTGVDRDDGVLRRLEEARNLASIFLGDSVFMLCASTR